MIDRKQDQEILSHEASTYTSDPSPDHFHPFALAVAQSTSDDAEPPHYIADNVEDVQTSSLSSDPKVSFAPASSPAACSKEGSHSSSSSMLSYVDDYRDKPNSQTATTPTDRHRDVVSADVHSAETIQGFQTSAHSRLPPKKELDNAAAADARLESQVRIPSVAYALNQSAKTRNPQARLRSKLSRLFGSRRKPREERPKSLSRLALHPQAEGR
ncbi:MAG: hypothetical protein Q9211_003868 [Gyalolechia sp. 1 TL-2023]